MEKTKLTVRVPRDLLEEAKRYAKAHNTSLTRLVSAYLELLSSQDDPLVDAPLHVLDGIQGDTAVENAASRGARAGKVQPAAVLGDGRAHSGPQADLAHRVVDLLGLIDQADGLILIRRHPDRLDLGQRQLVLGGWADVAFALVSPMGSLHLVHAGSPDLRPR